MEIEIKVLAPGLACSMTLIVDGDLIFARVFVIARTSENTAACTNIEICWFSFADWESDIRRDFEQISCRKDVAIETHMKGQRNESETGWRVWETLCQILGIQQ